MADPPTHLVTKLLDAAGRGEADARERLFATLYDELHALAEQHMAREAPGRTIQATALIHEAYLRLFDGNGGAFANRREFFASAAKVMRQILIDNARRRKRDKRGGGNGFARRPLDELAAAFDEDPARLIALDDALKRLALELPRNARVVELRFFSGLNFDEVAEALGVCRRTAQSDWEMAKAWLYRELERE